jgi:hypothetical protein
VWIVAYTGCSDGKTCNSDKMGNEKQGPRLQTSLPSCGSDAAESDQARLQKWQRKNAKREGEDSGAQLVRITEWLPEPNVGRVAHGVRARVDRLKSLGNAIVPQVAVPIMQAINQIEER